MYLKSTQNRDLMLSFGYCHPFFVGLQQACQTQTTSRAAKALRIAKGAAKVL